MPRISKSKTTTDAAAAAPLTVAETLVKIETAVKVEKPKKVKASKTEVETVSTPTPTSTSTVSTTPAAPVVEDVVVAAIVEDVEASIAAQSVEFMAKLNQFSSMVASLKSEYRNLEKKWTRELKIAQKSSSKKKKRAGNRAPSGFVKPTKISDELASFLGKDKGSEMARTDVTREINKYIRSHNLQDAGNGRKINPDLKLQTLLKLKKTDELTYFNLQRYMSPHFHKAEKAVTVAVAVATA
jgi:chromatin remodeling complex protein RSC6